MDSQRASNSEDTVAPPDVASRKLAVAEPMHPGADEVLGNYTITQFAPDQGVESDAYLAAGPDGGTYFIKLYRANVDPACNVSETVRSLQHRRLLAPVVTGTWHGRRYEVTPYFHQGSLLRYFRRQGPMRERDLRLLLSQLVEAIEALHHAGVRHRDLKPTNILLRSQEPLDVLVCDFGSSAIAAETLLTELHGTLAYAALEAVTGLYSRASDYWSLGVIMLEAITGKNPMHLIGDHRTLGYRVVQGRVPIPDSVPPEWRNLLRGLLEPDYSRRWDADKIRR
jgi:eukaryotic-like serine/threonine-protein kinase